MFVRIILFCFLLGGLMPGSGLAQDGAAIKERFLEVIRQRGALVEDLVVESESFTLYAKKDSSGAFRHRIDEHGGGFPMGDMYWTFLDLDTGDEEEDEEEQVEYVGTVEEDGRPLYVFDVTSKSDTTDRMLGGTLYLDTDSLFLRRIGIHVAHKDSVLSNAMVIEMSDYRALGGVGFPYALALQMDDLNVFAETEEDEVMVAQVKQMGAYLKSLSEAEREQQMAAIPPEVQFILKVAIEGSASLFFTVDSIRLNQGLDDAIFEAAERSDG